MFLEGDLVFINQDENIGKTLDFFDKGRKKIAVEDRVVKMWRESFLGLFHPFQRRESSDDENV
jgi:hypothetical protein